LKLQRLQNRALRATGNLDRCTPVCELQVAFKMPYVYAEVALNHINPNEHDTGHEEAMHEKYKRLKMDGSQGYDRSAH
jgi:hypothetical protein